MGGDDVEDEFDRRFAAKEAAGDQRLDGDEPAGAHDMGEAGTGAHPQQGDAGPAGWLGRLGARFRDE